MDDAVTTVRDALVTGELTVDDLTARGVGRFLGKTTSVVYHHWGSLERFIFALSESGFELLTERLQAILERGDLADLAEEFVVFGLENQALYFLMFERRYDWDALRAVGAFEGAMPGLGLWAAVIEHLGEIGSPDPLGDARLMFASLHGFVSLAASGRANVGDLGTPDTEVARLAARNLVYRLIPTMEPTS